MKSQELTKLIGFTKNNGCIVGELKRELNIGYTLWLHCISRNISFMFFKSLISISMHEFTNKKLNISMFLANGSNKNAIPAIFHDL